MVASGEHERAAEPFDDRIDEVTRAVAETVTDKLRVANPKRL